MVTIVNNSGTFVGKSVSANLSQFLGIQYAVAKRFEYPTDVLHYESQVNAQNFGAQSPQVPGFMEEILNTKQIPASEDCLFLNIWAPTHESKLRPVLFWIHGGAFTNGTAATSWYDGKNLASKGDVVVVSINYRLGPFGFIGHDNFGLFDQISALRWVQRNIASFGGDPDNVTIFGESAGGSSVVALTSSPESAGLIKQAWAMSPSLLQLRDTATADEATAAFLKAANSKSVSDLKDLTTQQILDATEKMFTETENYISTFSPTCGGPGLPADAYSSSGTKSIPLVVGTNRDENRLWIALNPQASQIDEAKAKSFFEKSFDVNAESSWSIYAKHRENHSPAQMLAALQTDENFRLPAWKLCDTRTNLNADTWMYWFTWATPVFGGVLGCCHALDLPFMFDNLDAPSVDMFTGTDEIRQEISDYFTTNLLKYAKTGDVSWPKYDDKNRTTLQIDSSSQVINNPEGALRQLWETNSHKL